MTTVNSIRTCSIPGCDRPKKPGSRGGLCSMHATRARRSALAESGQICRIPTCGKPIESAKHQLCQAHLAKLYRYGDPNYRKGTPDGEIAAYLELVATQMPLPQSCIIWPYNRDKYDYGVARMPQFTTTKAHRIAFLLHHGIDDPGPDVVVRHLCPGTHNTSCVNPLHLAFGTRQDNMRDMAEAGSQKGERNPGAKLTSADVRHILTCDASTRALADQYQVRRHHIIRIRNGTRWKHIYDEVMQRSA